MNAVGLVGVVWRKSTRSSGQGACVEVAVLDTAVAVRDSKHRNGPALIVAPADWAAFLGGARDGEFDQQ